MGKNKNRKKMANCTESTNEKDTVLSTEANSNSFTFSDRSIYQGEYYFEKCQDEYYDIKFLESENKEKDKDLTEEQKKEKELERTYQRIDIVMKTFKPWENIDKTKVEEKNISGYGGSKT